VGVGKKAMSLKGKERQYGNQRSRLHTIGKGRGKKGCGLSKDGGCSLGGDNGIIVSYQHERFGGTLRALRIKRQRIRKLRPKKQS